MDGMLPFRLGKNKKAQETPVEDSAREELPTPASDMKPAAATDKMGNKATIPVKPKTGWRSFLTKKRLLIIIPLVLLLAAGGIAAFAAWKNRQPKPDTSNGQKTVYTPPAPTTEPSHLTGVEGDPALNKRPVTAIMIENSPDSRPQSGLLEAGVLYEAIAEGGITRFLTLFQEAQPQYIGPVRSVRPYYLDYLAPYDAAVAHAGGSAVALAQIKSDNIKDLDQFFNSGAYQRISSRFAPHNLYTSFAALDDLSKAKGYTSSTFTGLARKKEAASAAPTVTSIDFSISSFLYSPHYDYDSATNSYKRNEGGKPHVDDKSGKQLSPKVVVGLVVPYGIDNDGIHSDYNTAGSGKAYVFQDGNLTEATWSKGGRKSQLSIKDAAGNDVKFNPGQTWFSLVASQDLIKYSGPPAPAAAP